MNRRQLLGVWGTGALVGLAGCLDTVADAVGRTQARPAYVMPPVGGWRDRIDRLGGGKGSLRANNHNTTRSNRVEMAAGPIGGLDIELTVTVSERTAPGGWLGTIDTSCSMGNWVEQLVAGDGDTVEELQDRMRTYLTDDPVIGEQFVVSIPSVDVPGTADPGEQIAPGDVLPTERGVLDANDNSPLGRLWDLSTIEGINDPLEGFTKVSEIRSVGSSGGVYGVDSTGRAGAARGAERGWVDVAAEGIGPDVDRTSAPVVARRVVAVGDGVYLPVFLYARRVRHAGDWLFVAGWVIDAGALFEDATTLLVDAGPNQVVRVSDAVARRSNAPASVVDALDDRARTGSAYYDGPVSTDLRSFLPPELRDSEDLTAFAAAMARSSGRARSMGSDAAGRKELLQQWLSPIRGENGDDDQPRLTLIPLNPALAHLAFPPSGNDLGESWIITRPPAAIRVLLVDDEPGFADLAAELLEREHENLSLVTATSGAAGLDYLTGATVDCVISDIVMPGLDGIEFLRAVREDHPELPFLFFTVRSWEEIAAETRPVNPSGHLQKGSVPDQYAVLAERVQQVVAQ